jgi:hypothetical protein
LVVLKDGSCALILQVTAINFGLLSEGEQDAIIYAYAGLLNSLTFQIQILIQSNIKDISDYIRLVREQESKQKKPLLLGQLKQYRQFVESTVRENRVLDKKFYVIIPFTALELGLTKTIAGDIKKKRPAKLPYPLSYILERAKFNLIPKRDHLTRQFGRIGLQSRQLNTQQILELFYTLYNRESVGQKFLSSQEYGQPIVQPAVGDNKNSPQPQNPFTRVPPKEQPPTNPTAQPTQQGNSNQDSPNLQNSQNPEGSPPKAQPLPVQTQIQQAQMPGPSPTQFPQPKSNHA